MTITEKKDMSKYILMSISFGMPNEIIMPDKLEYLALKFVFASNLSSSCFELTFPLAF